MPDPQAIFDELLKGTSWSQISQGANQAVSVSGNQLPAREEYFRQIGSEILTDKGHRRSVVLSSTIALIMTSWDLMPRSIQWLGITFESHDEKKVVYTLLIVVGFFMVSFIDQIFRDLARWRLKLRQTTDRLDENATKVMQELLAGTAVKDYAGSIPRDEGARADVAQWVEVYLEQFKGCLDGNSLPDPDPGHDSDKDRADALTNLTTISNRLSGVAKASPKWFTFTRFWELGLPLTMGALAVISTVRWLVTWKPPT